MNVLASAPPPSTAIEATLPYGFVLNGAVRVDNSGVMLVGGEAFHWRPWIREGRKEGTIGDGGQGNDQAAGVNVGTGKLLNVKGQFECGLEAWGVLDLVWPKPGESTICFSLLYKSHFEPLECMLIAEIDILIIGTGPGTVPLAPATRKHINDMGIRLEIQDTRNAAAQFNLLATERGVQQVAAALVPYGWKEGR